MKAYINEINKIKKIPTLVNVENKDYVEKILNKNNKLLFILL